jgi:hypothetical protein
MGGMETGPDLPMKASLHTMIYGKLPRSRGFFDNEKDGEHGEA